MRLETKREKSEKGRDWKRLVDLSPFEPSCTSSMSCSPTSCENVTKKKKKSTAAFVLTWYEKAAATDSRKMAGSHIVAADRPTSKIISNSGQEPEIHQTWARICRMWDEICQLIQIKVKGEAGGLYCSKVSSGVEDHWPSQMGWLRPVEKQVVERSNQHNLDEIRSD